MLALADQGPAPLDGARGPIEGKVLLLTEGEQGFHPCAQRRAFPAELMDHSGRVERHGQVKGVRPVMDEHQDFQTPGERLLRIALDPQDAGIERPD